MDGLKKTRMEGGKLSFFRLNLPALANHQRVFLLRKLCYTKLHPLEAFTYVPVSVSFPVIARGFLL